jgi:hypothetical protein
VSDIWTRRRFLGSITAAGGYSAWPAPALWALEQEHLPPPHSQRDSPEVTAGHVVPLLEGNVARPLRYSAEGNAFVIRNGAEFFNRPLYGPNIPFRVDGGDRPEFSLYLPGHGGNLRLGVATRNGSESKWLFDCQSVQTSYVQGRLSYEIRDPLLGAGALLSVECLTMGAGFWVELKGVDLAQNLELIWAFGGVSVRKGKRNGDIGCEVEPVSEFFQLRPEECRDNLWTIEDAAQGPQSSQPAIAEVQGGQGANSH